MVLRLSLPASREGDAGVLGGALRALSDSAVALAERIPPKTPASSPLRLCQRQPPEVTWGPK